MSSKAHFIYENGIEGFTDCNERQSVFGKFVGYNAYLIIEPHVLKSVKIKDQYLYIETKDTEHLPASFKIWGDAIIDAEVDNEGLLVHLEGGHHITNKIINKEFSILI